MTTHNNTPPGRSLTDAILAKIAIIRNCLNMIQKSTKGDPTALEDQMLQDVFVLNLERSAQACIDIAHLVISEKGFMMPASYKQAFTILKNEKAILGTTAEKMSKMAGFRNIAVHDYRQLDPAILKSILSKNLGDFEEFCKEVKTFLKI